LVLPTLTIRPATSADVDALREVYRRSSMSNKGDRALFDLHPELLDWSDLAVQEGRTQVAVADGRVAGFATLSFTNSSAEVEDLFVDLEWTRRGIGRALIKDIAKVARTAGWTSIEVDANPHALGFYSSVGFVAAGAAEVPYGTGLRMRRST
jgi:GNAT superfamily N-acetyltransferase